MEEQRARGLISGLKRFELTGTEARIIERAEQQLDRDGLLGERVGFILEWVYKEKTAVIRDAVFSFLNPKRKHRSYSLGPATAGKVGMGRVSDDDLT